MSERRALTADEVDRLMNDFGVDRRTPEQRSRGHHCALLAIRKRMIRARQEGLNAYAAHVLFDNSMRRGWLRVGDLKVV